MKQHIKCFFIATVMLFMIILAGCSNSGTEAEADNLPEITSTEAAVSPSELRDTSVDATTPQAQEDPTSLSEDVSTTDIPEGFKAISFFQIRLSY